MFLQFFGNYLLNKELISRSQLIEVLQLQQNAHAKLGSLAIEAGFMTPQQVEEVYRKQTSVDQRMGDIAVELGLLTKQQVEALLKKQKPAYWLLGQELVNLGYMTSYQFEQALQDYKAHYAIAEENFTEETDSKVKEIIQSFYCLHDSMFFLEYVELLFKNIIRFIGSDFTPLAAMRVDTYALEWGSLQKIRGAVNLLTGIEASRLSFKGFAMRYAGADFVNDKAFINDSVADFLNLQNGLFAVNVSNQKSLELKLEPPMVQQKGVLKFTEEAFCLPLCFSEGIVNFILAGENV